MTPSDTGASRNPDDVPVAAGPAPAEGPTASPEPPASPSPSPDGPPPPPVPPSPVPTEVPPDLAVQTLIRSTHLVFPHYHYRLRITVRNKGGGETPPAVLRYEIKPLQNAKGQAMSGTCDIPSLRAGEGRALTSDKIPYSNRGRFEVKVWVEVPSGTPDVVENNLIVERYSF